MKQFNINSTVKIRLTQYGEWKKVNYYPVSIEKLQRASMREAAYLIAPMNIGEDYEYFDEVKHLLIIPEKPKAIEELSQELNEKIDELLVKTQRKFSVSKESAEYHYNKKFSGIIDNFEYARKNGKPREKFTLIMSNDSLSANSYISSNFVIKSGVEDVGYYTFGGEYFRYYMPTKPNFISRFCMDKLLNFRWVDT